MNCRNFMVLCNIYLLILPFLYIPVNGDDQSIRKFTLALNPNCPSNCENVTIIYIQATKENEDVLHILIAGGKYTKTLSVSIIRSTDLNSLIKINWDKLQSGATNLNDTVEMKGNHFTSYFGLVFTKLYHYNDDKDTGEMPDNGEFLQWTFDQFEWDPIPKVYYNRNFEFQAKRINSTNSFNLFNNLSSISLIFTYEDKKTVGKDMPKLSFDANNVQFTLNLDQLNKKFDKPRFAVQFALMNDLNMGQMTVEDKKSLDDEYSPGVFRITNFQGQDASAPEIQKTYVQWKPVCYIKKKDFSLNSISVAKSQPPRKLQQENNNTIAELTEVIKSSIAYMVIGDKIFSTTSSMTLLNITFGMTGDGFYDNQFITWTASFGYGQAPANSISATIILVIIFGLGLPFVLVLFGSCYVVVKRRFRRNRTNTYVSVDDDNIN